MVSEMAIESEVFGGSVGEVNVTAEIVNRGDLLCYWWKYLRLIFVKKWLKIGSGGGRWCQVLDAVLCCLRVIEEIKKSLLLQGL